MPLWFYRRLLALYPSEFRREYGADMSEQFREDWTEARHRGGLAATVFWLRLFRDWMTSVTAAHAEIAGQDLSAAGGSLCRRPFSTAALVILLAVAIAGNTVLVVIADRLLLHPLPFEAQGRLVFLAQSRPGENIGWQSIPWSLAERMKRSTTLTDVAFFNDFTTGVDGVSCHVYSATAETFTNLGVRAAAGRLFTSGEKDVAVLGPRFWSQRYGRFPSAVGSSIRIQGRDFLVTGALKEQPPFPFDADVWVSLPAASMSDAMGGVFARLKPGVSLHDAQSEWSEIRNQASGSWPADLAWLRNSSRASAFDFIIWLCAAAFLVVLLLACADLASVQLGHAFRRQREVAIRIAVGAPRGRILRFLMTESILMALLAGILSLPVAAGAIAAFRAAGDWWGIHRLAGWSEIRFDGMAAAVTFALSLGTGGLAGFLPAWRFARRDPWPMLNPATLRLIALQSGTPTIGRFRLFLLSAQLALAVPILFLAIAFTMEGNRRLASPTVHYFDSTWKLRLTFARDQPKTASLVEKLTQRLEERGHRTIITSAVPFGDDPEPLEFEVNGARRTAQMAVVNARFFDIPGFHWREGKPWTEEGARRSGTVPVVVSETLATHVGTSVVLLNGNGRRVPAEVVGIVDLPPLDMYKMWAGSTIFLPYERGPVISTNLLVEGDRAEIEGIVHEVDSRLRSNIQDYAYRIRENASIWWWMVGGLWAAGLLTLALALTGVTAYLTQVFAERNHEVALRCALGGRIREIWMWVTRQVSPALAIGTAIAVALGAGALLAPSGLSPSPGFALWGAGILAIGGLWAVWCGASWLASARAAAESLMDRLRHS